jgi:hypothetical protein
MVLNFYTSSRYIFHMVEMIRSDNNHLDTNDDGKYDLDGILIFVQWLMMLIGTLFNFVTFFLYGPICRLVH